MEIRKATKEFIKDSFPKSGKLKRAFLELFAWILILLDPELKKDIIDLPDDVD